MLLVGVGSQAGQLEAAGECRAQQKGSSARQRWCDSERIQCIRPEVCDNWHPNQCLACTLTRASMALKEASTGPLPMPVARRSMPSGPRSFTVAVGMPRLPQTTCSTAGLSLLLVDSQGLASVMCQSWQVLMLGPALLQLLAATLLRLAWLKPQEACVQCAGLQLHAGKCTCRSSSSQMVSGWCSSSATRACRSSSSTSFFLSASACSTQHFGPRLAHCAGCLEVAADRACLASPKLHCGIWLQCTVTMHGRHGQHGVSVTRSKRKR